MILESIAIAVTIVIGLATAGLVVGLFWLMKL